MRNVLILFFLLIGCAGNDADFQRWNACVEARQGEICQIPPQGIADCFSVAEDCYSQNNDPTKNAECDRQMVACQNHLAGWQSHCDASAQNWCSDVVYGLEGSASYQACVSQDARCHVQVGPLCWREVDVCRLRAGTDCDARASICQARQDAYTSACEEELQNRCLASEMGL